MRRIICILKLKLKRKLGFIKRKLKKSISKIGTLNIALICVGLFFVWFNCQMLDIFRMVGSIPETYACGVIVALLGECGICGAIKTTKEKEKNKTEEYTNPDNMNNK